MISRYVFRVETKEPLQADRAYAFYSSLLSLLPCEYVDALHEQKETPVAQCLYCENSVVFWRICLLDDASRDTFYPVLNELAKLPLTSGEVDLDLIGSATLSADELIGTARALQSDRFFTLRFLTPTAFKQNGKYTVLPDKELILQSLFKKWNAAFPMYPLDDEDAFRMLAEGIRIADYNLRTTRFPLKSNRIPGFIGTMSIDTNLSAPLLDIWKLLVCFATYSGIGIKTALGMGGISLLTR